MKACCLIMWGYELFMFVVRLRVPSMNGDRFIYLEIWRALCRGLAAIRGVRR